MTEIGERIRAAREIAGLEPCELGNLIGKGSQTVWRYETGRYEPSVSTLRKIAEVLDVSLEYLLGIAKPLEHVKLIEFSEELGPYRMDKVALVNGNRISEEEAKRCIEAQEYNDNVLCIPKKQWVSLFKDDRE